MDNLTPDSVPLKQCTKCEEWKPATAAYFPRQARANDGLHSWCKRCISRRDKTYRAANKEKRAKYQREYQREHKEKLAQYQAAYLAANKERIYEQNRLYRQANNEQIREWNRRWRATNRTELVKKAAEWKKKNPDKVRESTRRYYLKNKTKIIERTNRWSAANPQKRKKCYREWRARNLAKARQSTRRWRIAHPDRAREATRRWNAANPDKGRATKARRYARKRSLPANFTFIDWQRCLDYFCNCCAVCGRPLHGLFHEAHADHWIPLSHPYCPGTVSTNIIPLCGQMDGCNQSKQDKLPAAWLASRFTPRKAAAILARVNAYFEWVKVQT